jgi:hypothetical protein
VTAAVPVRSPRGTRRRLSSGDGYWAGARHGVKENEGIFRRRLLILAGDQLAVLDDVWIVGADAGIFGSNFLKNRLRIVRDQEATAEHALEFLVTLKRITGGTTAADPLGNVAQGDGAVADRANDFVLRLEMLKNLGDVFVWIKIERRASAAGDMHGVVFVEIDVLQPHRRLKLRDQLLV